MDHACTVTIFLLCFIVKPEVYIYKIDGDFLVCNATGFPLPSLTWYKNNQFVKSNTNNERTLTIKETGGNFTCVASNSAGISSKSFAPVPGNGFVFLKL